MDRQRLEVPEDLSAVERRSSQTRLVKLAPSTLVGFFLAFKAFHPLVIYHSDEFVHCVMLKGTSPGDYHDAHPEARFLACAGLCCHRCYWDGCDVHHR
jgi:hypothetical protein